LKHVIICVDTSSSSGDDSDEDDEEHISKLDEALVGKRVNMPFNEKKGNEIRKVFYLGTVQRMSSKGRCIVYWDGDKRTYSLVAVGDVRKYMVG
jgi:hypothetical protein